MVPAHLYFCSAVSQLIFKSRYALTQLIFVNAFKSDDAGILVVTSTVFVITGIGFLARATGAGLIIFSRYGQQIVLVESNYGDYDFGFPKGYIEKRETSKQAAVRETDEETGLKTQQLAFVPLQKALDEYGWNSVSNYYVAGVKVPSNRIQFRYNSREIRSVRWYLVDEALRLPKLYPHQKRLLIQAQQLYIQSQNQNTLLNGNQFIYN
ncbi:unnamed protein product [Didymodactylos carnosus]|uniref:Nudix hydrolase domain-containing protein n=1 Tax=Didymodactylos carnosus TaxID=1234261 RepID=A0A815DWS9_9BILA|nr:unnamed protein product [Didymodactylos carnosus]CAF1304146.1 unnamed protein product [Didymodactylos carnosus]CAF3731276.1 unnamed protein product [Didymodactylos carnosus]CAF4133659.1 unnamed protein product [Didymodactylos carnosus]